MGLFGKKKVFGTIDIPGRIEFELPPGKYKVHYEINGEPDESTTSGSHGPDGTWTWHVPENEITVTSSGGPEPEVEWKGRGHTIRKNGRSDKQMGTIKIPKPGGLYAFEVAGDPPPDEDPVITVSAKV